MLALLFVIFAFASRFLPHPWHFTPVAAALLFFGARGSRRQMWFPVALLALSDVILTKYVYGVSFSWDVVVSWAWYAAILLLGTRLRDNAKPLWIGASALAASVSFFLVSNFAVWAFGTMYSKDVSGLFACYSAGVAFFRHDLLGTVLYTAAMFATPVLLKLPREVRSSGPATV